MGIREKAALMGWLFAIGFACLALGGLMLSGRMTKGGVMIVAATLLLALAGYAWQGSPLMAGHPVHRPAR